MTSINRHLMQTVLDSTRHEGERGKKKRRKKSEGQRQVENGMKHKGNSVTHDGKERRESGK